MKRLKRSVLPMGLCLVPALVFATAADFQAPGSTAVQDALSTDGEYGICREVAPAEVGMDAAFSQDCEMESASEAVATPLGSLMERKPKPCSPCPDQPWCACTYNGQPRTTCDPCCYQTYTGEICLS